MIKSYYAYLNSYGPISFSFDLYFIDINPTSGSQTTASKPITTRMTTTTTNTNRFPSFPITTLPNQNAVPCKNS